MCQLYIIYFINSSVFLFIHIFNICLTPISSFGVHAECDGVFPAVGGFSGRDVDIKKKLCYNVPKGTEFRYFLQKGGVS